MSRSDRALAKAIAAPGFKIQRVWSALLKGAGFDRVVEQGEGALCLSVYAAGQEERREEARRRGAKAKRREGGVAKESERGLVARKSRFLALWDLMKARGVDMGQTDERGHGMEAWALRGWVVDFVGRAQSPVTGAWFWLLDQGESLDRHGDLIHRCVEMKSMEAIAYLEAMDPETFTGERVEASMLSAVRVALGPYKDTPSFSGGLFGHPSGEQLDAHDALAHLWRYVEKEPARAPKGHELSEAMGRFVFDLYAIDYARDIEGLAIERREARALKEALERELRSPGGPSVQKKL